MNLWRTKAWPELLFAIWLAGAMLVGCGDRSAVPSSPAPASSVSPFATQETVITPTAQEDSSRDSGTVVADSQPVEATASQSPAEAQPAKPKRAPIYDPEASGQQLIEAAVERAKREHKHVLIEWGGNWCGWCYRLHDVFTKDELVSPIVFEEFELVLVDEGKNHDLMLSYGGRNRQYSYPHLTVLDADGQVLTNQNTAPLEEGKVHSPTAVAEFLKKWIPEKLDAEDRLADALKTAAEQNKRVLVRVGTPYCGWCKVLNKFMHQHQDLFATDYVDLKIDTSRMTHGEEVASRYAPQGSQGVPWMVILDEAGKVLSDSVGPKGNIGYPMEPEEVDHFLTMLRRSRERLTDRDLEKIATDLTAYRVARQQRQQPGN